MLIVLVFAMQGAGPVPAVNEPHYLGKAKHFWQPDWLRDDFFLDTADSHLLFYVAFGWVTRFASLPATAWIGRLLTWALLAWSWRRLSWALIPQWGMAVLTAALFVTLQARCQVAGEWVIGGVEAKGFAYVLVFLALEALVRGRWNLVWILLGAATAFHVLVGGWSAIAAAAVWWAQRRIAPSWRSMLPGMAAGGALALLGLIPALSLTWNVPGEVAARAAQIYVFVRLPHHLLPQSFPSTAIALHVGLAVLCAIIYRQAPASAGDRRLRLFVVASVLLAIAGVVVACLTAAEPALQASLLRYYWFRLTDVMLPVGVAIAWVAHGWWRAQRPAGTGPLWLLAAVAISAAHLGTSALANAGLLRGAEPTADEIAWREACEWTRDHTSEDTQFLTPRLESTFKWHAQRREVVTWKDVPQDAASIVEWWRRMQTLHAIGKPGESNYRWLTSLADHGPERLRELGAQYGAQYALVRSQPPIELPVEYRNSWYTVYRLEPANAPPRTID